MRVLGKIFLGLILLLVILSTVVFFALRTNNPRDLGVKWSEQDLNSGRAKGQVVNEFIKEEDSSGVAWKTSGKRDIKTTFSSSEITAIMNNKKGAYYPYKNIQVKFNADGSAEISGRLIKSRIPTYGSTFDAPKVAVDLTMKFLPENPVFYLKGKATLAENQVEFFEPQRFEIGRIPMPLGIILASAKKPDNQAYAMDVGGFLSEISSVNNKRQIIIDFINSRLSNIEGFYAKKAYYEENKLNYEGTLPEKEIIVE